MNILQGSNDQVKWENLKEQEGETYELAYLQEQARKYKYLRILTKVEVTVTDAELTMTEGVTRAVDRG